MKVNWSLTVNVEATSINKSGSIDVDAYDIFEVVVPIKTGTTTNNEVTVDIQPGTVGDIRFVLITSDNYEALECIVDPASTKTTFILNGPVIKIGTGAASLLGKDIKQFKFVNSSTTAAAKISILIGRIATV